MDKTISLFVFLISLSFVFSQEECINLEKGITVYQLVEDEIDFSYLKNHIYTDKIAVSTVLKIEENTIGLAINYFEKSIRTNPNTLCEAKSFFYCGVLYARLNEPDISISFFEKFFQKNLINQGRKFNTFRDTYKSKAHYLLSQIYFNKKQYKKASSHIKPAKKWYLGAYSQLWDKEKALKAETRILHSNILLNLNKPKKAIAILFSDIFHAKESNDMIDKALLILNTKINSKIFLKKIETSILNYKKDKFGIMTIYSINLLDQKIELPFSWFKNTDDKEIIKVIKTNIEKSYFYTEILKLTNN